VLIYLFILQLIHSFLFIYLRLMILHSGALVNTELEKMRAKVLQAQCELLLRYFPKGAEKTCNCWWVSRVPCLNFNSEPPIYEPAEITRGSVEGCCEHCNELSILMNAGEVPEQLISLL